MYSDESDDASEEVDVYRKKYRLIIERCEAIQQVILSVEFEKAPRNLFCFLIIIKRVGLLIKAHGFPPLF